MFSAFFTCRCVNRESLLQPSVYYLQIQSKIHSDIKSDIISMIQSKIQSKIA